MREIKFRGIKVGSKEFVEGSLVMVCSGETLKHYPCIVISYNHDTFDWHEVVPETVGQYTGITNKKDKEIYEGDIVKIPDNWDVYGTMAGEIREIYFGYGGFRLKPKYKKDARGNWLEDADELEIIGNIHDNPELIGE